MNKVFQWALVAIVVSIGGCYGFNVFHTAAHGGHAIKAGRFQTWVY